jgi:hypothetical protein
MEIGMPPEVLVIVLVAIGGLVAILRGPLGRALARRIEGAAPTSEVELDELRARVAALEAREGELVELHERLEFAERLLAQRRAELPKERPTHEGI